MGKFLKSKTVWGAIFAAGAWVTQQADINPFVIVQAIGGVLTAIGVKDAISKVQS